MLDWSKMILVLGLIALLIGVVLLTLFAFFTGGASRNISLGLGTLLGAAVLLGIQLKFELRGSKTSEFISTEFTYDLAKPALRQWQYPASLGERFGNEVHASEELLAKSPDKFVGESERDRLVQEMAIFSLVTYVATKQHDWQTVRRRLKMDRGQVELFQWTSQPEDCSLISDDQIHQMLQSVENPFANVQWFDDLTRTTCLPPKTIMRIEARSLILKNPFCEIAFRLIPTEWRNYLPPPAAASELQARGITQTKLPDGSARFVTYGGGFEVVAKYSAIRAQHVDQQKYAAWAREMIDGVREWFESRPNAGESWLGGLDAKVTNTP
jgi:hypothetical protein